MLLFLFLHRRKGKKGSVVKLYTSPCHSLIEEEQDTSTKLEAMLLLLYYSQATPTELKHDVIIYLLIDKEPFG